MGRFLTEEFDAVARRAGTQRAVVSGGGALSYEELASWIQAVSAELERYLPLEGRTVAIVLPSSAAFVASFFGVSRSGGVVAPLNIAYRSQELEYYLNDMNASAVIVCPATLNSVSVAIEGLHRKPALFLIDAPGTCELLTPGDSPTEGNLASGGAPVLLLYTSGSTGAPKRVLRTHRQLLEEIKTLANVFGISHRDRFLGAAPFFHVNGLVRSMLNSVLGGATLYPVQQFSRRGILQLISEERITYFGGVPQMFVLLARTPPRGSNDLSSLRIVFSSSAPLLNVDNEEFHRVYGIYVRQLYGSTETGTISFNNDSMNRENLGSVGRPLPGVSLSVLDGHGNQLPAGREGEIAVRSGFAATSYDGNVAATQESFRDSTYLTGDLGKLDSRGNLTLTGRKKLIINRGGYKVNPHEVEEAIRGYPKVVDVAVLGAIGLHGDEIVRCVVVARENCRAEEIVLHCRDRIADYKIPSQIEFRENLPKTPTGKLRRDCL